MLLSAVVGCLVLVYFSQNIEARGIFAKYHMNYLTYIVIGVAFYNYLSTFNSLVENSLNPWWLEEILLSPIKLSTLIVGSIIWNLLLSSLIVMIYLGIGSFIAEVSLNATVYLFIIVLLFGIVAYVGLALIGSAFVLVTKQKIAISLIIQGIISIFGNVFFPPDFLPESLRSIAYAIPHYYFFTTVRFTLIGCPVDCYVTEFFLLIGLSILLLIVGYWFFRFSINTSKKLGTLSLL